MSLRLSYRYELLTAFIQECRNLLSVVTFTRLNWRALIDLFASRFDATAILLSWVEAGRSMSCLAWYVYVTSGHPLLRHLLRVVLTAAVSQWLMAAIEFWIGILGRRVTTSLSLDQLLDCIWISTTHVRIRFRLQLAQLRAIILLAAPVLWIIVSRFLSLVSYSCLTSGLRGYIRRGSILRNGSSSAHALSSLLARHSLTTVGVRDCFGLLR